jgi:putative heme-binding domain-containing protein
MGEPGLAIRLRRHAAASPTPGRCRVPRASFGLATLAIAGITLAATTASYQVPAKQPPAAPQKFYKDWKMEDLLPSVSDLGSGHDWNRGRELFKKAACGGCHAFASESEGSGLAPDLTGVASIYSRDFILQSILEPSATLNGRYYHTKLTLKDGRIITGSIIDTANKKIVVAPVMLAPQTTVEIAEADVKSEEPSPVSPMPPGLLNGFTKDEVVELMAFLDSGGDRSAPVYKKHD